MAETASTKALNIFGIGITSNNNLDLLNLIVLACAGVIIKVFFKENYSRLGNVGPATTTIWGYGLTGLALTIMVFVAISYTNIKKGEELFGNGVNFYASLGMITPIIFTLLVIIYIIYLNIIFFTRINSNKVTLEYHTYSAMSSVLTIIQIFLVATYLYYFLVKKTVAKNSIQIDISQNAVYILSIINFMFLMMIHISLEFFATDETPLPPKV